MWSIVLFWYCKYLHCCSWLSWFAWHKWLGNLLLHIFIALKVVYPLFLPHSHRKLPLRKPCMPLIFDAYCPWSFGHAWHDERASINANRTWCARLHVNARSVILLIPGILKLNPISSAGTRSCCDRWLTYLKGELKAPHHQKSTPCRQPCPKSETSPSIRPSEIETRPPQHAYLVTSWDCQYIFNMILGNRSH